MPRPCKCRRICANPSSGYFKPRGIPMSEIEDVNLTLDEFEAIRLADLEGMYQEDAAKMMKISRQTFGNIIESARRKVADAIINGKALKIEGGVIEMRARSFMCSDCEHEWTVPYGKGRPGECPKCKSQNIHRSQNDRGCARAGRGFGKGQGRCLRGGR